MKKPKPFKTVETGLDKLLYCEVSDTKSEPMNGRPKYPPGTVLTWPPPDEEIVPTIKSFHLLPHSTFDTLWVNVETTAKKALQNKAAPEHIHSIAKGILKSLRFWKFNNSSKDNLQLQAAFCLGEMFQRLNLWTSEQPAAAGRRIRAAAQEKGRAAPSGSVRAFLETIPNWWNKTNGSLLLDAKKQFPYRSQANLLRQIRRLRNPTD